MHNTCIEMAVLIRELLHSLCALTTVEMEPLKVTRYIDSVDTGH